MLTDKHKAAANPGQPKGDPVSRLLSRRALIFFLLALSGLIFLLRNILTLENLSYNTASMLFQPQNSSHPALAQKGPLPPYKNHTICSHLEPTPDEALEDRALLDAIVWPKPPAPTSLNQTSDPVHSLFAILPSKGGRERRVGDQLEALVQMQDFQGRPKHYGGDFLVARLHSPKLGAGVAGTVVDHLNGSYSALFPLLWEGPAQVTITMVHSSEAVAVLQRLREQRSDRFFFRSLFRSGKLSENTVCNMCLPHNRPQEPLCNYTDLHTGEPWYCLKPKRLSCDTRINHFKGGYKKDLVTNKEALLFQSRVNIKVVIHASGPDRIDVLPKKIDDSELRNRSIEAGPVKYNPAGYYYKGSWRSFDGTPVRQFDAKSITQCLTGKVMNMYGDSTMRQWFEYLRAFVPEFNLRSTSWTGPLMAVDCQHNILLNYRSHNVPIGFPTIIASELRYVANELDRLPGGPNTVVALSLWAHFSPYPVEVYIRRMRHIRRALERLLVRGPGTLVIIRSPNLRALDKEYSLNHSDWFSLQLGRVLRNMFMGLAVVFVDAWEMTLAHHSPHNIHPPPDIIKNTINLVLTQVCPAKKS
ncbi:NXPE family member 3-like isoform X2 [Gadus chalcogrammus]|uniref:NXPE family member 3-like isoform X2 n=1 Tax=Gadus chalcogrammus TaxID=1042646 RepID=UPI0024C4A963|nr:NXPE family member 3-like isoform X2 [Gadus chalcogrammus]XP_056434288.1 NXPE family member 3-like isoform X2 [Gadus chalcogrammus]XP_056434290.1 NXPE family member 3-like isoform X2 [Gadus chalcogrammus]